MNERTTVVIQGVESAGEVPGLEALDAAASFRCANGLDALRDTLPGAEVLLGWQFAASDVRHAFECADRLRWIQWCGAGVDAALFPALVESDVTLTNLRGVFDRPMAEYTLGMILAFAKDFRRTGALQRERTWSHRLTGKIAGTRALVVGAGSIGRAIGRTLRAAGIEVEVVGRSARDGDPEFGRVHGNEDLDRLLGSADWVVLITPLTAQTRGMFGAARFAAMKPTARFFNLGRGALVDEPAMIEALEERGHRRRGPRRLRRGAAAGREPPLGDGERDRLAAHVRRYLGLQDGHGGGVHRELPPLPRRRAAGERRRQVARLRPRMRFVSVSFSSPRAPGG